MPEAGAEPVRRFIAAFNERDLDGFVAVLDDDVEIHASRGLRHGLDEAREWATRKPGGVQQTIVVEDIRYSGEVAVALITREWRWDPEESTDDELVGRDEMAWLFELRDDKIRSWRPFDDRSEALRAAGLG